MKTQRRVDSKIPSLAIGRWTAYTAAATATTFAAAPTAEATIHYSGLINSKIHGQGAGTFSLGSGAGSFIVRHFWTPYGSTSRDGNVTFQLYAGSPSVNGFFPFGRPLGGSASVSNLNRGDAMSTRPFVPNGGILAGNSCGCSPGIRGQFLEPGVGFVGFKFNSGLGDQYGWVRVRMRGAPWNNGLLIDFAYGDPGERVVAGQMESDNSPPRLESLGGLALGAAGLLALRKRKQTTGNASQRQSVL